MLKTIAKWLLPSNRKLAEATASEIQRKVNAQGQSRKDTIAKYATIAQQLSSTANQLASIAADGEVSDAERAELAAMLEPLCAKTRELVGI